MKISSLHFLFCLAATHVGQCYCFGVASSSKYNGRLNLPPVLYYDSRSNNNNEANDENEDDETVENKSTLPKLNPEDEIKERRKSQVAKAAARVLPRNSDEEEKTSLLDKLNPFNAGQSLRKSFDSALTSLTRVSSGPGGVSTEDISSSQSVYYLDDRFKESGGALFTQESNPYLTQLEKDQYVPEILIVGAKSEVGRLVCKRLLLEGRSRVRVLVPDLYSRTLNMLGTGVVYYQGDLDNMDSLETALTDVDKIVHINSAPRPDEDAFKQKFMGFAEDNLRSNPIDLSADQEATDMEWERMESVLEVRASLAREIDYVGMQNLVKAYQNVRFADYGTGQAAKRSLFKFKGRPEDFNLFTIDDGDTETEDDQTAAAVEEARVPSSTTQSSVDDKPKMESTKLPQQSYSYPSEDGDMAYDEYAEEYDKYAESCDDYDDYAEMFDDEERVSPSGEQMQDAAVKTQVQWIRNELGCGVFVGRVPQSTAGGIGGEASIISSRLRTRDGGPEEGIDLSGGFGGFVCRVCADGEVYEAFIRDANFEKNGIEYVCNFSTVSKAPRKGNASRNKFITVRLPFESFKPVRRRSPAVDIEDTISPFRGKDVRYIGFRYRSSLNLNSPKPSRQGGQMNSFYIAFSYIKVYRIQPEPEIVYLSDACIPPVVLDSQVRHDLHQLVPKETLSSSGANDSGSFQILDDNALRQISSNPMARSPEETYYKYRGEQVLKASGLSYCIIRCAGYNEEVGSEASTIDLKSTDEDILPVSRREAAQVCVSALLDPNALNKSLYISKKDKESSTIDETISAKFSSLPTDPVK